MMTMDGARRRAAATALILLLTGGVLGILVDRLLLLPPHADAASLTTDAMVARLQLSQVDEARFRALHDSLHDEIVQAAQQGADSLQAAAHRARLRIEAVLPPHAQAEFHTWMREHHEYLMGRLHGGAGDRRSHADDDSAGHGRRERH